MVIIEGYPPAVDDVEAGRCRCIEPEMNITIRAGGLYEPFEKIRNVEP